MSDYLVDHDLERLVEDRKGPCVTMYLPTFATGFSGLQAPIRLKTLCQQAQGLLEANQMRAPEAREFLRPVSELVGDTEFWKKQTGGLAIFLAPGEFHRYRLDLPFAEKVAVGDRFYLRPILPAINRDDRFFILSLSRNKVELLEANKQMARPVEVPNLPANITEALNVTSADRGEQVHAGAAGLRGKESMVFHGQGGKPDSKKEDLLNYFRQINSAVAARLHKEHRPLILACVDYEVPIYRETNTYPHLVNESISGNADYMTANQLHEKALPLIQPELRRHREKMMEQFQRAGTDKASSDFHQIVPAAYQGRVDKLFVDISAELQGVYDNDLQALVLNPNEAPDHDLVETAVVQTMLHGGTVQALDQAEMPVAAPMAALLRF